MMRRFRKLCEEHRDRIFTFARYYLGNREDAEDATQEVLLRLWDNWREVEAGRLPGWITRVTRNACLDALRRRKSYRSVVSGEDGTEVVERTSGGDPGPEVAVEAKEFRERLERALETLPEAYRSVVVLREIQGMKYDEIGAALGLPLNTVKVYLHRGRRALREELRHNADDERS